MHGLELLLYTDHSLATDDNPFEGVTLIREIRATTDTYSPISGVVDNKSHLGSIEECKICFKCTRKYAICIKVKDHFWRRRIK